MHPVQTEYATYLGLGLAGICGLLVGFEREQSAREAAERGEAPLGGVRTHPLVAIIGALAMLLSRQLGVAFLIATLAVLLVFLAISYADDVKRGNHGLTSETALLLSFLLGVFAASESVVPDLARRALVALAIAVVATVLLSIKLPLHDFVARVSREDIFATLKFLLVSVVVLPLLPDESFGPYNVLNPRSIGLMVVLIAGVSFVGYVAVRVSGPGRGLAITGLVGGLVSSTAVTLSFSGRARENPALGPACALAVTLASTVMFARVMILVGVVAPPLLPAVAVPLVATVVAGLAVSLWLHRRGQQQHPGTDLVLHNPFELGSAVKFALLYAFILVAAKAANVYLGSGGTYVAGVLAGTTDVDAITLSVARMVQDGLDPHVGATTILLAVSANTLVKAGMAVSVGGWAFGRLVLGGFVAVLAVGAVALAVLWLA